MRYDVSKLKGDLSGGLVAGVIALPLALAFGVQSGLGAAAGLYGAIALGILGAALGSTRSQACGPTGPMVVISASVVAIAIEQTGSLQAGLGIILLSFLLGGILQIVIGLLGIGKFARYFPYPVISGFMSGVGVIIIALQLWPFLGSGSPGSVLSAVTRIAEPIRNVNTDAVLLGAITVGTYYLFPRITKAIPAALVALIVGTAVSVFAGMDVPAIGDIPAGLPSLRLGEILSVAPEHYPLVLQLGLTLAVLGTIDTLLTSVIVDNIVKTRHDARRELFGQGVGNAVAALFGGIPGSIATKLTLVNLNTGGTTRLSGIVHALFLLMVLLGLGRFVGVIPLSVLAGLLIPVGLSIIDYKALRHLRHLPLADGAVLLVVLAMTVFGNLIHAVGAGVALASILFMKKASDLADANASVEPLRDAPWEDEVAIHRAHPGRIYIKHLYGPLFFGAIPGFRDLVDALDKDMRALIIRMDRVSYIDQSGLYALEDAILELRRRDAVVLLTGVRQQPMDMLRKINIVPGLVPEEHLFRDIEQCTAWLGQPPQAEDRGTLPSSPALAHQGGPTRASHS